MAVSSARDSVQIPAAPSSSVPHASHSSGYSIPKFSRQLREEFGFYDDHASHYASQEALRVLYASAPVSGKLKTSATVTTSTTLARMLEVERSRRVTTITEQQEAQVLKVVLKSSEVHSRSEPQAESTGNRFSAHEDAQQVKSQRTVSGQSDAMYISSMWIPSTGDSRPTLSHKNSIIEKIENDNADLVMVKEMITDADTSQVPFLRPELLSWDTQVNYFGGE